MISGDNGWRVPPVPIPNTEVKPPRADGTWLETARETMSLPDSKEQTVINSLLFRFGRKSACKRNADAISLIVIDIVNGYAVKSTG